MARSPDATKAERINAALECLQQHASLAEAAQALTHTFGISKRQAYRYLKAAQAQGQPMPVPERKIAFTVKLSEGLIQELRQCASQTGLSLSELVSLALEAFLRRGRRRGR